MDKNALKNIVKRCATGEQSAQLELYRAFSKSVYNSSLRILGSREDAEEVMQDTFIKVFNRIERYLDAPETIEYSLKRIAINNSIDILRKKKVLVTLSENEISSDLSNLEDISQDEQDYIISQAARIREAIEVLPKGYKSIIALKVVEDISNKDIAVQLGTTESNIRSQYLRAKRKVLEILKANS